MHGFQGVDVAPRLGRALLGEDRSDAAVSWSTALVLAGTDSSSVVAMTTTPSAAAADGSAAPRRQAGAADHDGAEAEDDEQPEDRGVGQGLGGDGVGLLEVGLLGCHRLLHAAEVTEDLGELVEPGADRRVLRGDGGDEVVSGHTELLRQRRHRFGLEVGGERRGRRDVGVRLGEPRVGERRAQRAGEVVDGVGLGRVVERERADEPARADDDHQEQAELADHGLPPCVGAPVR